MEKEQVSSTRGPPEDDEHEEPQRLKDKLPAEITVGIPVAKEICPPRTQQPFSLRYNRLYGRDQEEQLLLQAYERAITTPSSELVLISGPSGTGKTTLARTLRKQKGFFLSGKFEEMSQEPYAVFVEALTEYADRMYDTSPHVLPLLKESIANMVNSEGGLLTDLIPALTKVMGPQPHASRVSAQAALQRFRFVFGMLVKAICMVHPLVVFMDDLQWADDASLDLIKALLLLNSDDEDEDRVLPLLVVGAHRPLEEQDDSLLLSTTLDDWHSSRRSSPFTITAISLSEWDVELVNQFTSDLLEQSCEETLPLARLVHSQTHGNVFLVLQFLKLLNEQGMLYQQDGSWHWDLSEVESSSAIELLLKKLRQLPRPIQKTLEVAACMGTVDDSAIALALDDNDGKSSVASSLLQAADAGLLVFSAQAGGYRFAHDRIREAALALVDDPDGLRLRIGRRLWNHVGDDDDAIFSVVALLNGGSTRIRNAQERYRLADLNLRAAEKAASLVAFPDAAFYVNRGIDLLGRNHWTDHYRLSLALYDLGAEVEMCNANFERVKELIAQVLEHGRTLKDKLRCYATLINSVGQQDDMGEAMNTGFRVLRALGEPIPKKASKWAITKELMRTKWMLRGMTVEDFCAVPPMTNENKIECSEILFLLLKYATIAQSPFVPIISLRAIQLFIKYGQYPGSSYAFACYGLFLCGAIGNMKEGTRMGEVALRVLEASGAHEMLPRVYGVVYAGIYHWTRPLRETLEPAKSVSLIGMMTGDIEHAMLGANIYCAHAFYSGRPLGPVEEDLNRFARTMKIHKQENSLLIFNPFRQTIHNLTGQSDDPCVLKGDIMDIDIFLKETHGDHNVGTAVGVCLLFSVYAAYLFGDFERAGQAAEQARRASEDMTPTPWWGRADSCFVEGLAAIALARQDTSQSIRKRNLAIARTNCKTMSKWAKDCPFNFRHKQKLLEAELLGVNSAADPATVLALYNDAIEGAKLEGFVQDQALACERASDYMQRTNDLKDAAAYRCRARSLYLQWGATAKAALLADS